MQIALFSYLKKKNLLKFYSNKLYHCGVKEIKRAFERNTEPKNRRSSKKGIYTRQKLNYKLSNKHLRCLSCNSVYYL